VRKARRKKDKGRFWQIFELDVSEYEAEILMLLRQIVSRERGIGQISLLLSTSNLVYKNK
jgi:hypothetical protein